MENSDLAYWREDAADLAWAGQRMFRQALLVEVRLPTELAERAAAAWSRDDGGQMSADEFADDMRVRHRAAAWALIGLAIEQTGRSEGLETVFMVDAWQVGKALDAAEEDGILDVPEGL